MIASLAACVLACVMPVQDKAKKLELPKSGALVFGIAKVSQDGKSIAVNRLWPARTQTYTVQVPFTRVVKDDDGNTRTVTEIRTETRQRVVPTAVTETYTVMVPVRKTVTDEDGNEKEVTTMVPTTRTRSRIVGGPGSDKPKLHAIAECEFRDVAGKPVANDEVAKRLKERSPIVMLQPGQKLEQFYRMALNPKILLVTLPVPKPPGSEKAGEKLPAQPAQNAKNRNDK